MTLKKQRRTTSAGKDETMKPARVTLTVTQGIYAGKQYGFDIRRYCMIGRAGDCDIQLPMDYAHSDISRHHCVFEIDPPSVRVRDLGSANGTYVNGVKIGQRPSYQPPEEANLTSCPPCSLQEGDEIQVGHVVLQVHIDKPRGGE
jgi:pSer/pThr/pTyr-binding forkhead associated (FHA) protein